MSKNLGKWVWDPKIWHYRQEKPLLGKHCNPKIQYWMQKPCRELRPGSGLFGCFWGRISPCRQAVLKILLLCFTYSLTTSQKSNKSWISMLYCSPHSLHKGFLLNLKLALTPFKTSLAGQEASEILSLSQSSQHVVTDTCDHSWLFMRVLGP